MSFDRRILVVGFILLILAFAGGIKYQGLNESKSSEEDILLEDIESTVNNTGIVEEQGEENLIQVYVCGQVQSPGIYIVKEGARLHEVIELASALEDAQLKYLGMARELVDGETIVVPGLGDIDPANPNSTTTGIYPVNTNSGKLNINQASAEEMASKLNGIGPVLAGRIIDYRSANGPFKNIEDLQQVSGIGEKKFNDIKDSICVR